MLHRYFCVRGRGGAYCRWKNANWGKHTHTDTELHVCRWTGKGLPSIVRLWPISGCTSEKWSDQLLMSLPWTFSQAAVSSSSSTTPNSETNTSNNENFFSITEEGEYAMSHLGFLISHINPSFTAQTHLRTRLIASKSCRPQVHPLCADDRLNPWTAPPPGPASSPTRPWPATCLSACLHMKRQL